MKTNARPWLAAITSAAMLCATLPAGAGQLELIVNDQEGKPLPCRVLIRPEGAACIVPDGAVSLQTGRDRWFMTSGRCTVPVPDRGSVLIRVERGPEYVRVKKTVDAVTLDEPVTIALRRWVNMAERGYRCGENHLHVDTVQLAPMLVAEGLDYGTSLTWWRGPDDRRPIPAGSGRVRMLEFAGHQVPTSVFDAELEYAWGAAYIQNLPAPMPIRAEPGRPNLDYLQHAVDQGAIVHYQGGWSREVLLNALLGCVHTVNVCNNNFALHRFQPRSIYSNLLKVEGFPTYPDTDAGMLQMNTDTYYRLLNCGLRLAAGAGTATGVKQAPVGYNRAYVQVPVDATIDEFYDAWKSGRNFVTNGPVLFLNTESGQSPGDTIELPAGGGKIRLHVEAMSDQPLTSVELVVNGQVLRSFDSDDPHHVIGTVEVPIASGAWIAARCTVRDGLLTDEQLEAYVDDSGRTPARVAPSRLRFAHTSPVYVNVAGRGTAVASSLREGLQMIDQFQAFARENASPEYQPSIHAAIVRARQALQAK